MRAKVNYTCDWASDDGDDQTGHITIEPSGGGKVTATWECRGGKGRGTELRENTTQWTDEFAEIVLDTADLCQGQGEFIVEIEEGKWQWPDITLIEWIS